MFRDHPCDAHNSETHAQSNFLQHFTDRLRNRSQLGSLSPPHRATGGTSGHDATHVPRFEGPIPVTGPTNCVSMHCDLTPVRQTGRYAVSRISIVSFIGELLLDVGIRGTPSVHADPSHLLMVSFMSARTMVQYHVKDKVVVGYNLSRQFNVLKLKTPWQLMRDFSKYAPFWQHSKIARPLALIMRDCLYQEITQDSAMTAFQMMQLYHQFKVDFDHRISVGHARAVAKKKSQETERIQKQAEQKHARHPSLMSFDSTSFDWGNADSHTTPPSLPDYNLDRRNFLPSSLGVPSSISFLSDAITVSPTRTQPTDVPPVELYLKNFH